MGQRSGRARCGFAAPGVSALRFATDDNSSSALCTLTRSHTHSHSLTHTVQHCCFLALAPQDEVFLCHERTERKVSLVTAALWGRSGPGGPRGARSFAGFGSGGAEPTPRNGSARTTAVRDAENSAGLGSKSQRLHGAESAANNPTPAGPPALPAGRSSPALSLFFSLRTTRKRSKPRCRRPQPARPGPDGTAASHGCLSGKSSPSARCKPSDITAMGITLAGEPGSSRGLRGVGV